MSMTRRDWLRGTLAGAFGAGLLQLPTANAQISPTAQDVAAYYRFSLGDAEMIVISDASFAFPPGNFAVNQPEADVTDFIAAQRPLNADGTVSVSVLNLVMIQGDSVIIFDTGNGAGAGKLVPTLDAIGIGAEGVSNIVMSHFHPDHVGGISTDGELVFPNATLHIPQAEFDFLQSGPEDVVGGALAKIQPTLDAEQAVFYENGGEVAPGILSVPSPGHTPGHQAFVISSGDASLLHVVDAIISTYANLPNPGWHMGFDGDPEMAVESRQMLIDMAVADSLQTFGYHWPFPGLGYVTPSGDAQTFVPVAF